MPERRLILIVEDEPAVREMLVQIVRTLLDDLDVETVEAADGDAARAAITARRPALVVTDLMMPGSSDGIDLIRALRAEAATASVPVIALSADSQRLARATAAGAAAALRKPCRPGELAQEIRQLLG